MEHGGDIYRNKVNMDFSVNLNPLGAPKEVLEAVRESVNLAGRYPDIRQTEVRRAIAEFEGVSPDCVYAGNGASELIMALVRAVRPKKAILFEPCFSGYEYALRAAGCEIISRLLSEEDGFNFTSGEVEGLAKDDFNLTSLDEAETTEGGSCSALGEPEKDGCIFNSEAAEDIDMIFLCNPGNPGGRNIDDAVLIRLLDHARERGITVCLDESFFLLSEKSEAEEKNTGYYWGSETIQEDLSSCNDKVRSAINRRRLLISEYDNLIIITSLTKLFAMPGIRMGYAVASPGNIEKLKMQLPEWNLPVTSEAAIVSGMRVLSESDFLIRTMEIIRRERSYLSGELITLGMTVYESDTTFILFKGPEDLGRNLLKQGILIRDCSSFEGLGRGYFRIAVRKHEENERLITAMRGLRHGV